MDVAHAYFSIRRASIVKGTTIKWLSKPQKHDYPAAQSYLSLICPPRIAKQLVARLKHAPIAEFAAKDIFRATGLALLRSSDIHVNRYRRLIALKQPISPLLLFRDTGHGKAVIADGYHRLCAVYTFDEDAMIPCQII
ncbi:MAG: hypothetical protein ACLQJ0_07290 [Steroidobacteraceae bacterium]|jgi:hypothetical protein